MNGLEHNSHIQDLHAHRSPGDLVMVTHSYCQGLAWTRWRGCVISHVSRWDGCFLMSLKLTFYSKKRPKTRKYEPTLKLQNSKNLSDPHQLPIWSHLMKVRGPKFCILRNYLAFLIPQSHKTNSSNMVHAHRKDCLMLYLEDIDSGSISSSHYQHKWLILLWGP